MSRHFIGYSRAMAISPGVYRATGVLMAMTGPSSTVILRRALNSRITRMSEPPFNRTGGHHRVLLVGPDSSHQDYLGSFLEAKGFRVIRARAIGEACQKFAVASPHVLLADLGPLVADPYQSFAVLLEATQSQMPPTPLIVLNKGDDWGPGPNA